MTTTAPLAKLCRRLLRRFGIKPGIPNHGPCAACGKPVIHCHPYWTTNPDKGGLPLHDACWRQSL